jgi:membrane-bound serine protease (ClpP class)
MAVRTLVPLWLAVAALALLALPAATHAAPQASREVPVIELSGTIDPATAAWIKEALNDARDQRAPLAIVRVDTPGGLSESMREIVQAILRAPMPVVVHVAPDGARAASAGLFVTLAADVAAMAPRTNIGSATPVSLGGGETSEVLGRKVRNDAVAYARALAETRERNADLAERMVRRAQNVTAREAADRGLIELVAGDTAQLLDALDGRELPGTPGRTLETERLTPVEREMPLQYEIQQLLVNPNIAYVLLLAGLLALAIELLTPGLVGPGLFGAVALLLGLYGTAQLPVTAAGVVLLTLGVAFLAAELAVGASGVMAGAGAVALAFGGLLLYDTDSQASAVSLPVAAAVGASLGLVTVFALGKALALRRAPARGGAADLFGAIGTARTPLEPDGHVAVAGELWRARVSDDEPVPAGERVRVAAVDGLTLNVRPTEPDPTKEGS